MVRGVNGAAHEAGLDRQFAMAAVDEHAKLNAARTPMIEQRIERRARGPAGIENVVHQDDVLVLDLELHRARPHFRPMTDRREIVAVERDVQRAHRHFGFLDASQHLCQPLRQRHTAAHDSHQPEIRDAIVFLHDFVCQPNQSTFDFRSGKDLRLLPEVGRAGGSFHHAARIIREAQAGGNLVRAPCDPARAGRDHRNSRLLPNIAAPIAPPAAVKNTNTTASTSNTRTMSVAAPCGVLIHTSMCCVISCTLGSGLLAICFSICCRMARRKSLFERNATKDSVVTTAWITNAKTPASAPSFIPIPGVISVPGTRLWYRATESAPAPNIHRQQPSETKGIADRTAAPAPASSAPCHPRSHRIALTGSAYGMPPCGHVGPP